MPVNPNAWLFIATPRRICISNGTTHFLVTSETILGVYMTSRQPPYPCKACNAMYWSWGVRETPSADVRHRLVVRHESLSEYSDECWLLRMVVCLSRSLQRILESLQWLASPLLALACTCISICFRSVQRPSRAFFLFFLPCRQSGHPWYPLPATMLLCFMEAAPWLNRFIVACHHLNRFLPSFWVESLCFSRCALFACTQTIWCF